MALDTIEEARAEIAKIYIAAFNRVPDAGGLSNWMNQYMAGVMTYEQIAEDFTNQTEYTTKYPSIMTNTEYVTAIYNNVFGRTPDAGGLVNWVNQLDHTAITGIDRGNIMTYMLASAASNTDGARLDNQASFAIQSILSGVPEATATAQLANITSDATTITTAVTAVAGEAGAVLGSTFTLTTGSDTVSGTANNDTINAAYNATATANTLGGLDVINGGAGTDTLAITNDTAAYTMSTSAQISNVEKITIRGVAAVTADVSGSNVSGLQSISVTQSAGATVTAAATTDVIVSGSTGAVIVDGGKAVSVTAGTGSGAVTIGATTGAAGAITVTDTVQGANNIAVDGGTNVSITATATNAGGTTGTIKVGADASPILPTGTVTIVDNLTNAAAAATNTTGGAITVVGGTAVTITETATQALMTTASTNSKIVQGAVSVTGSDATTSVTVNQTAKVAAANTVAAVAAVTETDSVVFSNLTAGQTLIVGGLTFTAGAAGTTAAQTAAAFANLTNGATSGTSTLGTYTGTFSGWTTGAATGTGSTTVVFTSSAAGNVADLAFTGTGQAAPATAAPAVTKTEGVAAVAANAGVGGVDTGTVQIADKDYSTGVNSITTATVNGYKTGSWVKSDALTTLSLANSDSAATFDVYNNTATTLDLTLNKVTGAGAVSIDAGAAKYTTLNVTTTGSNSAIALTAAAVTALTVTGTNALDLTGSTLSALKTVVVSGSAGLTVNASGATVTDVNASATSGNVTATIDATKATYEGGSGVDTVTTSAVAPTKAISLGDGNDKLILVSGTTSVTGAISGGNGTDTLEMVAANAATASGSSAFATHVTGFEQLQLDTITTNTVDLATLGNYNYVIANGTTTALTLNGYGANGTLVLNAANTLTTATLTDATGNSDVFNISVTSDTNGALNAGTVAVANVETLNVSSTDSNTTTGNTNVPTHTLAITDTAVKTMTITGDAQLTVTTTGATALTTVDASAMTAKLVYSTTAANATVTGGSGNDALTAATAGDTLIGGAGNDTLTSNAGVTTMTGGTGNDLFIITTPTNSNSYSTITDFGLGDTIRIANAATFNQTKMTVLDTSTFTTLLNAAAAGNASDALTWFQYNGNTYIVEDHDAAATFQDGSDVVVKLTGLVDLSSGILNANVDGANATALTIH